MVVRKLKQKRDIRGRLRRAESMSDAAWRYASWLEEALEKSSREVERLRIDNKLLRSGIRHAEELNVEKM